MCDKNNTVLTLFLDRCFRLSHLILTAISLMFRLFFIFLISIILRTVAASESATGLALVSLLTIFEIRVNFYVDQSLFENKQKNYILC